MSTLWLDDMETESLTIAKDEHVTISNVACVAVITGRARALDQDGHECKIRNHECPPPQTLVGLEDDTNVILFYGSLKRARMEYNEDTVQNLITEYGERLIESLKAFHGLPIILESRGISVEGTISDFELDRYRVRNREYPRITVMISMGSTVPMTHVEFTHELLKNLPPGSHARFWDRAWIKQDDTWIRMETILPPKVRAFTDKDMLEAFIRK